MDADEEAWSQRRRATAAQRRTEAGADGREALALWADFPALGEPRALVLLDGPVRIEGGFSTGRAKRAVHRGAVVAEVQVPEEPLRRLRAEGGGGADAEALQVRSAVLERAWFSTDRGHTDLPAWRVTADEARGPIWVLADEYVERCWPHPSTRPGSHNVLDVALADNGLTLRVGLVGGKPAWFRYDVVAVESPAAVALIPVEDQLRPLSGPMTLEGYRHEVRVQLAAPLSGRVLIRATGTPIEAKPLAAPGDKEA